jgi:hypothetical protein
MSNVIISVRERSRGNVTTPLLLWALAMAVVLFVWEASKSSAGVDHAYEAGLVVTTLLGVYLGWKRRSAATFVAPLVSWMFAWFPLLVASMIHHGILKGFFIGLVTITVGWIGIGFVEFAWLSVISFLVRMVRGGPQRKEPEVTIFGPGEQNS